MATRLESKTLPYGVGHLTVAWYVVTAFLLAILALGLYAYSRQLGEGEIVTGMRDIGTMGGAPWGIYIAFVVYFVGVSFAGITIAGMVRLLNLEHLRPIARMAELLTVITLVLGAFSILADVGQPLRALINLPRYARPMSPFFGTFTLVIAGYLFASLVYLYLAGRRDAAIMARQDTRFGWLYRLWAAGYTDTPEERERHRRTTFWLALGILPLLLTAHSTLGFVFGLQAGRPGWFSALQAPAFVVLAGVSGTGLMIVIAAILRRALGATRELSIGVFRWLSNFLMVLTAAYLYFMVVEWLVSVYAAPSAEARVAAAVFRGDYAWIYWLSAVALVASFVILFVQYAARNHNLALAVIAGLLVNLAAIGKRYEIVIPSQTHGTLLPYGEGLYRPSWVEYSVILGLIALGVLLYMLFMKVFPIIEAPESGEVA